MPIPKPFIPGCLWLLSTLAAAPALAAELSMTEAVELALANNPGLAAANAATQASRHIPPQAGSLPDPVISLQAMNLPVDSFSTTQENMTQMQLGVSQKLPFPGKLALRERSASLAALASGHDEAEARLQLARSVRGSWWSLFYLERANVIVGRNQELLRQFIRIAESKYKLGKGLQQDVLLAQLELSKLLDRQLQLSGTIQREKARLNALLGRASDTPLELPETTPKMLPETPPETELLAEALASRPWLAGQRATIEAAEAEVELAGMGHYPDFTVAAAYGFRQGINPVNRQSRPDLATAMLSFNVPLFADSKQKRLLDQRKAERLKAGYRLEDMRHAVEVEVSQALADYTRSAKQARLFEEGIIPQASQTVASMLAGYQVGKVDFLNLVNAQITLYNYETLYWRSLTEANQALASLDAAIGRHPSKEQNHER